MKRLGMVLAAITAILSSPPVGFVTSASAQEFPEWWDNGNTWEQNRWESPRRFRPPPPDYRRPPDDDDAYDIPRDRRAYRRSRDDDSYGYDTQDDQEWRDRQDQRRWRGGRDEDRAYRNRDDQNSNDDQDNAQWPAEEGDPNKMPGADGGSRPFINAVAPPQIGFNAGYAPGSIIIDTGARRLYYVTSSFSAYAYPIGVGREGFAWTGSEKVSRIQDWPDWYPPAEMRKRKPELPERMFGGLNNPLGAKAIYLGNTLYRIHGTNDPRSIGKAESSGCFRMLNQNVLHLAQLVKIGTPVTVVKSLPRGVASATGEAQQRRDEGARTVSVRRRPQWWDQ